MKILAIETSCDETSAAIISKNPFENYVKLLSNVVTSSLILHAKTGGIIPEVAAREQVKFIIPVIESALVKSNLYSQSSKLKLPASGFYRPAIDAIAVTVGPGLIGSLLVGVETAKTLAYLWNKPIIPVNHLLGHIYANFVQAPKLDARRLTLDAGIKFPAIALLVSGGHTDLLLMKNYNDFKWLGGTRDDAAGEAFDKIGRLLNLPYPAGPAIEMLAKKGDEKAFTFPSPMIGSKDFDFSFSGLKAAVNRHVILNEVKNPRDPSSRQRRTQDDIILANLCASVQKSIIKVLVKKTIKAAKKYKVKSILLGGGVASNKKLNAELILNTKYLIPNAAIFVPQKSLCTDNAAMIGAYAAFHYNPVRWEKITANPELYFYD